MSEPSAPPVDDRVAALEAEVARLKRGAFTVDEFQALCHHRDENPACGAEDFYSGCHAYQHLLFGSSERDRSERLIETCRSVLQQVAAKTRAAVLFNDEIKVMNDLVLSALNDIRVSKYEKKS